MPLQKCPEAADSQTFPTAARVSKLEALCADGRPSPLAGRQNAMSKRQATPRPAGQGPRVSICFDLRSALIFISALVQTMNSSRKQLPSRLQLLVVSLPAGLVIVDAWSVPARMTVGGFPIVF